MMTAGPEGRALRRLRRVQTVVFDCDSTLSAVEGIDTLAERHRAEIEQLTDAAMRGELPLEQVYGKRLDLVQPTRTQIDELGRRYVEQLVPDAPEVVRALRAENIGVRIMSGGLRPAVVHLGRALGLASNDVAAVDLHFRESGEYGGFDRCSPLARNGGKRDLLKIWRRELSGPVMMVGDGATDLEASDVADVFVAYAGVVSRPPVVSAADLVVHSHSLAPVFVLALAGHSPRHQEFLPLFRKGMELLEPEYQTSLAKAKF